MKIAHSSKKIPENIFCRLSELFLFCLFLISSSAYSFETTADEMVIDQEKHIYTLKGKAIATWDDKVFEADTIIIHKKEEEKIPTKITATNNVLYKEEGLRVTSKYCESDMRFVIFTNNVILEGVEFGVINADNVVYDIKTKKVDITATKKVQLLLSKEQEKVFNGK